jgi:nucleotide-binding universal stress UspA family protein
MPGILAGVDGSDHSRQVLKWAMREAAYHHVPLTVMTVRPDSARPASEVFWGLPELPDDRGDLELLRTRVQRSADKIASEIGVTVPELTVRVVTGHAAGELVKASHDADLVVVGCRGGGGILMGSVSSQVTHHAACPVVVIPGVRQAP